MKKPNWRTKWNRGLLLASIVALGLTAPAQAGQIILLDPTGGGGANPNNVLAVSSFAWLPGNALAVGGGKITASDVGKDIPLYYQAILGSINTAGANSAFLGSNNGNILIAGAGFVNTGIQFIVTGKFVEKVASVSGTVVTFAPDLGAGPNAFSIYAQSSSLANVNSSNAINRYPGVGSTLILTGTVSGQNFTSSFNADPASFSAPPLLNQHAGGSGDYPGIRTISGTGNTSLTIDVTGVNQNYFLSSGLTMLNFNTISAADPFRAVDPALLMFNGSVPNLGSLNGAGQDFLFQSQANNDFTVVVPEPTTISLALSAFGISGLVAYRRRKVLRKV